MKLNWGTGIGISLILFIIFILHFFVKTIYFPEKYNHELVTEDYYKQEIEYQPTIDKEQRTKDQQMQIRIAQKLGEGITLFFPEQISTSVKGSVKMYRPSNEKLDFEFPIILTEGKMIIEHQKLIPGRWNIYIDYSIDNQQYRTSFKITY